MTYDPDCIGLCLIENGVCLGCGRTEVEIDAAGGDEDYVPLTRPSGAAAAVDLVGSGNGSVGDGPGPSV